MSAVGSIFRSTLLDLGLYEMRTLEADWGVYKGQKGGEDHTLAATPTLTLARGVGRASWRGRGCVRCRGEGAELGDFGELKLTGGLRFSGVF